MQPTPPPPDTPAPGPPSPPISITIDQFKDLLTQAMQSRQSDESWGGFFRGHFSVFVLLFMCVFMFVFILHLAHHATDDSMLQFAEGHSQTFVGALVGALTTGGVQQLVGRMGGGNKT